MDIDGIAEGTPLGFDEDEGCRDGCSEGHVDADGAKLSSIDGRDDKVGMSLGIVDGASVVGLEVGNFVGFGEGFGVGLLVGGGVGAGAIRCTGPKYDTSTSAYPGLTDVSIACTLMTKLFPLFLQFVNVAVRPSLRLPLR